MMGEANPPNSFVAMGQEMIDYMSRLYRQNPGPSAFNGVERDQDQVNPVAPGTDAKTLAKKKQLPGLKRLGLTSVKAVSDAKGGVIPRVTRTRARKGKPLTPFRKKKIQAFNDMIQLNPEQASPGRMWSPSWIDDLVQFMNQFGFIPVAPADVTNWLKGSKDFFQSELARLQAKPQQKSPDPARELPNPTTKDGGNLRPLAENHDEVVPVMASAPESSSDSKDAHGLDAEAVMMDFISLAEDNSQPHGDPEHFDPESVFNSLSKRSPQAPSGIEEIKPTPKKITDDEPLTTPSSTGVRFIKKEATSDVAQVPIAVRDLYSEGAIELCGDLNPMLLHLAQTNQLPADKENLQLFTKVLLKLVENGRREGSSLNMNLEACLHTMRTMTALLKGE